MKKCLPTIAIIIIMSCTGLFSQSRLSRDKYMFFGIYTGINYNIYNADFNQLPEVPNCCPNFNNGDGFGFNGGLLAGYAFSWRFSGFVNADFMNFGGELVTDEYKEFIYYNILKEAKIRHSIDIVLKAFRLGGGVEYKFTNVLSGLVKFNLIRYYKYEFSQKESIVSPPGVTFEDGRIVRNEKSGDLPDVSPINMSCAFGIRYYLYIKNDFFICPELNYNIGLFNIIENTKWRISNTSLIINFIYAPDREQTTPIEPAD